MASSKDSPKNIATDDATSGTGAVPGAANPAVLTVDQLARLLGLAERKVREHVGSGAPTGVDGTINLVRYTAWLNRRLKERDGTTED